MVFAHILRQNSKRCDWSTSSGYMVSFCLPGPTPTASMVLSRCLLSTNRLDCFLIKQRIWRFLHDEKVRWIQVSNNGITSVTKSRFRQPSPRFVQHCFVRLKQGRKPIVWIEAVLEEVNVESIVRSMVCEKELHQLASVKRPEKKPIAIMWFFSWHFVLPAFLLAALVRGLVPFCIVWKMVMLPSMQLGLLTAFG